MTPWYADDAVTVWHGDCLDVLADMAANTVDAVCTDPPYGLEFMGKDWDRFTRPANAWNSNHDINFHSPGRAAQRHQLPIPRYAAGLPYQQWCQTWAEQCLRVLKPGGHLLAFGGTRTHHRLACAIEDAGFEIRDTIAWIYGSGFPKSLDVGKAIDRAAGAEREVIGQGPYAARRPRGIEQGTTWDGWGTALKPSHESIVVARKPLQGTVAANVLTWGTGALNVDAARVGTADGHGGGVHGSSGFVNGYKAGAGFVESPAGRWPPNVALDQATADQLDQQSGNIPGRVGMRKIVGGHRFIEGDTETVQKFDYGVTDQGGASRFFPVFKYEPKAPTLERPRTDDAAAHPTVKPLDLMRWLVRLVCPPGGVVLDPFLGSGTTAEACIVEGFRCIGVERETAYLPMIRARLTKPIQPVLDLGEL